MIAFLFYNADLLDIAEYDNESTLAFVDDSLVAVEGNNFKDTTSDLSFFMNRDDGGFDWSKKHNSRFEIDKLAVMHCTNQRLRDPDNPRTSIPLPRPELKLQGRVIEEVENYKYLGVMVDSKLRWGVQGKRAAAKAINWILLFRRLTQVSTGMSAKLMRRLYLGVAIPKITYGADIWFTPLRLEIGKTRRRGSVAMLWELEKVQ